MLKSQQTSEEELPFGLSVRALNEIELESILGRLGQHIGPILNRHTLFNVQTLVPRVYDDEQAASALFDAFMSIAPQVIAFGCDEPDAEGCVQKLPVLLAITLLFRTIELTVEKWGFEALFGKLSLAAGQNSTIPEFLFPMVRDRVAAMKQLAAAPSQKPNRKERRRASSRRSRR